jgi:hypothetical protein
MSRSYKKPYVSTTTDGCNPGVMKTWKKQCNKTIRKNRPDLGNGGHYKKTVNQWDAPNDGKVYNPSWKKAHRK